MKRLKISCLISGLLILSAQGLFAAEGILDFDRFKQEIEPLLTTTTYSSPGPSPMTCVACHGDSSNAAYTTYPLVIGQSRDNFVETAQEIALSDADTSDLLLKPLGLSAGGVFHGGANTGGEQFTTTTDIVYQALLNWILDATRSSVGARISKSVSHPNPFRFHTDLVYFLTTEAQEVDVFFFSQDGHQLRHYVGTTNVGANRVRWNGRDEKLEPAPTGVYFYTIKAKFDSGTVSHNGRVVYTP